MSHGILAGGPLPRVEHDRRVAHLHLMPVGNDRWLEQIDFRDALRANLALIAAYAAQTLSSTPPGRASTCG